MNAPLRPRPPRHPVKIRSFGAAELSTGEKVVRLDHLLQEMHGRVPHIDRIYLTFNYQLDSSQAGMTGAMPGEHISRAIQNVRLNVGDHHFVDGLDGHELLQLADQRVLRVHPRPADVPDADDTDQTGTMTIPIYCGRPRATGRKRFDGSLPTRAFQNPAYSSLRFTVSAPTFTGVTWDGFTSCDIWVTYAHSDKCRMPTPWQMRRFDTQETFLDFETRGPLEALLFATRASDTVSDGSMSNYTAIKALLNGRVLFDSISLNDIGGLLALERLANGVDVESGQGIIHTGNADPVMPIFSPLSPDFDITQLPRGNVRLEWTNSTDTVHRFLIRESGIRTPNYERTFLTALGAPLDKVSVAQASARKDAPAADVILDSYVFWDGMPWDVPNGKN